MLGCPGGGKGKKARGRGRAQRSGAERRLGWAVALPGYLVFLGGRCPGSALYTGAVNRRATNRDPPNPERFCRRSRILAFVRCQEIRQRFPSHLAQRRDKCSAAAFLPRQAGTRPFIGSNGLGLFPFEILEYRGHKSPPQRFLGLLRGSHGKRARQGAWPRAP